MTYQTIDFETNCVKVSTFLRRLGKKYPKFTKVWGELIEYACNSKNGYYHEVIEDNYVLGVDAETDGHFYVWFQARCKDQIIDGEGTIYNVTEPVEPITNAEPVEKPMFAYVKEKATKKNAIIRSSYATKNEKEVKKAMKKTNREFKVNGTTYSVVNNQNYNKDFAFEPSCMKYYAMKLLTTDNTINSWVKVGITGNTIDNVKEKVAEWEDFMQYVENTEPIEPAEPAEPVNNTTNLKLSDDAITHIRNAYNWIIGGLINGLCDNKPVSNEYKECFNMLHGGEKLVNHIYNECLENGFDVGWCGLGQAPAEIKKYDSWLIKNHIRNMLELDNIFSLPADNSTVENEILNIPAKKMNSILDLIEQCNSCMEKSMLLDYVSFETGVSYDAIRQIYDDYIKETFLDDDGDTFDSVLNEIIETGWVVGSDNDIDADFKKILGNPDDIPF